jgi:hypothetical protein
MRITGRVLWVVPFVFWNAACTTYFETPTSPTTTAAPDPSTFASHLVKGGSASRAFAVTNAGSIQVMLSSVTPSVIVGVGLGIPRPDGSGCHLGKSVETTAGSDPQITALADSGMYCVKIYDVGHVEDSVSFAITVSHP